MAEPPKPAVEEQGEEAASLAHLDQDTPSLLDVALGNMEKEGKVLVGPALLPARVVVAGRTPSGDVMTELQGLIAQCRADADAATEKYTNAPVQLTGILFAYTCGLCLFCAELPTKYLLHFLAALEKQAGGWDSNNPLLTNIKILSATDDVPYAAFQDWHTATMATNSNDVSEFDGDDAITTAASDVNLSILRLADRLSSTPLETMVAQWSGIPQAATLAGLLAADGAPTLQARGRADDDDDTHACAAAPATARQRHQPAERRRKEFLDLFSTPVFVDLDTEKTWPVPQPLKL